MNYVLFSPSPDAFAFTYKKGIVYEQRPDGDGNSSWYVLSEDEYTLPGRVHIVKTAAALDLRRIIGNDYQAVISKFADNEGMNNPERVIILEFIKTDKK